MDPKFEIFDYVFHKSDSTNRVWMIWKHKIMWGSVFYDIRLWQGDPNIPKTGAVDILEVPQWELMRVPDIYWTLFSKHG